GVGVKAYSIIEQGQVEQLLTASKQDRRAIFEEAAGISKYKAHKKEALRKLERTDQNLLRLADVLSEVQKQLRSIKLQAGKARNFLEYKEKLKGLQVNYSLSEYHKIITSAKSKRKTLNEAEEVFASVVNDVSKSDTQISEIGSRIIETENRINEADNALVSVKGKIEQCIQRIEFLNARIAELEQNREQANKNSLKQREQHDVFCRTLEQYNQDKIQIQKQLEEKDKQAQNLNGIIEKLNSQCASVEAELEDEKSGIIDIVRRTAQLHNELQSISNHRANLSNQKDRLSSRAGTVKAEFEELLTQKAQFNARLSDIENIIKELEENLESKRSRSEELDSLIEVNSEKLARNKEIKSALDSENAVLSDMENRHEGINTGVKTILQQKNAQPDKYEYIEGLVAEIIEADIKYANAVESALEGKADALIVCDSDKLMSDKDYFNNLDGRVTFICTDKLPTFADSQNISGFDNIKGRLAEFIKCKEEYKSLVWSLLGKTLVVDDIQSAIERSGEIGIGFDFVTLSGQFFSSKGSVNLGSAGKSTGLISRKSRLNQLKEEIDSTSVQITQLEHDIQSHKQSKEHLSKLRKELRTAIYEANTERVEISSKIGASEQNIDRLSKEQPLIASEIKQLEEQIEKSVQTEYNSKQQLEELEEVNQQRSEQIEKLEKLSKERKLLLQSELNKLTDIRVSLGQIKEQNRSLEFSISNLQEQIKSNDESMQASVCIAKESKTRITGTQREILECESKISELFSEKEKCQITSRKLHEAARELIEKRNFEEQKIKEKRHEQSDFEQKINEIKIELSQLEVREQSLIERVSEELQIDLINSYDNYQQDDIDWNAVRDQINDLKGKIERLGNINLDAIEQQKELEQRNDFLSKQVEDLTNSKTQLEQLISKLNKQSIEKFEQTFEEIRQNFQQIFRKLFGGGKADIIIEDSEDILEAGIEIVARPPGKEQRSISLLSGGEKTMTAIALLFSMFKTKPSPFCLLDEVDAALDEANNERFNMIVNEFRKNSQFIIITHSKRTMSMAELLYGITMQTRGVSKKISVKFGDYEPEQEEVAVA
nr:chromosome segregation protein SMC [Planctomycetota bacterium]